MNLADLYRMTNREPEGEKIILAALKIVPDNDELNLSYALWLVREKRMDKAMQYLKQAAATGDNPHFKYVYAIALSQQGKTSEALEALNQAAAMPMYNRDVQLARIEIAMQINKKDLAEKYLMEWSAIDPEDPAVQQMTGRK